MDVAETEAREKELDVLISRRHEKRVESEGHRLSEELYEESVRAYNAQRAQERRAEWAAFHRQQAERHRATLTDLVAHHLARAEMYTADTNGHHHEEDSCSSSSTRNAK